MQPSPDLAGKIERAGAVVNAFLRARPRLDDDYEAVDWAVRRYSGLDAEARTPQGRVRRDYAAVLLRDLLTDLALWEDVHGRGGQELLHTLRARWNRYPFGELDGPARHIASELASFATEHSVFMPYTIEKALATYTEEWEDSGKYWKEQASRAAAPGTAGLHYTLQQPETGTTQGQDRFLPTAMTALSAFLSQDRPSSPATITRAQADGSHAPIDQETLWQDVLEETGPARAWRYTRAAGFDQVHMTWKEAAHRVDETYLEPVTQGMRDESRYSPVMLFRLRAVLLARDQYSPQDNDGMSPDQALDEALKTFVERTGLPHRADEPETAAALLANLALILDTQGVPARLLLQPADTAAPTWPEQTGLAGEMAALLHARLRGAGAHFPSVLKQALAIHDTQWRAESDYLAEQVRSGLLPGRTPLRYILSSPAHASHPAFEQPCPNAAVAWLEFLQRDSPQRPVDVTADLADGRRVPVDLAVLNQDRHFELHHDVAWNESDWPMARDREQREEQAQATWLRQQLANVPSRPDRAAPRRERIRVVFGSVDQTLAFLRDQAGRTTLSASARENAALRTRVAALTWLFARVPAAGEADRLSDAARAYTTESATRQDQLAAVPPSASPPPQAASPALHHHLGAPTPGVPAPGR
ncbi:hypothetical protein PUR49_08030 [Streptomyces sp. BE147]|uniref:hypothetical protein n=1 Tax=Streptomyces sp. BE147 TaxID=3002524 RepID=UPI002E78D07A|nr:hypothetical protein [Streptomyces sp. BE147]MEE1736447.1 hypothetical protein [Streptomyces sp. BE147]